MGLAKKSVLTLKGFDKKAEKGGKRTFGGAYAQAYMVVVLEF
jgi:hypothetical protein